MLAGAQLPYSNSCGSGVTPAILADLAVPLWFAAYTNARHEKFVAHQLQQRRIQSFLPLYRSLRQWKDRRKEVELPLFPGYIFVRIALADRLNVLRLPGVIELVGTSAGPCAVAECEIENLRIFLGGGHRIQPHPFLKVGRRVRVNAGPLAGLEGILIRRKEKLRVVLSIELISRSVSVEVDETMILPV